MELEAFKKLIESEVRQRLIDLDRWGITQEDIDQEIEKEIRGIFKKEEAI